MQEIYKEQILHLYRNPSNKGVLDDFDAKAQDFSTSCGDDVTIYIKFDDEGGVANISHDGHGCAISTAAVSLLTDEVKGKNREEIKALTREQMIDMLGIPISHTRRACAVLGLKVLQSISSP
jgi:nitrogen fixation protein NifU and related proteins